MAVVKCGDCSGKVSTRVSDCPHCGAPRSGRKKAEMPTRFASIGLAFWYPIGVGLAGLVGLGAIVNFAGLLPPDVTADVPSDGSNVGVGLRGAAASLIYLAPTLIGVIHSREQIRRIALINLGLGWTGLGWGYALWRALADGAGERKNLIAPSVTAALFVALAFSMGIEKPTASEIAAHQSKLAEKEARERAEEEEMRERNDQTDKPATLKAASTDLSSQLAGSIDTDIVPAPVTEETSQATASLVKALSGSDDYLAHEGIFLHAATKLKQEFSCSESHFAEYGGFIRSASVEGRYFTYCGNYDRIDITLASDGNYTIQKKGGQKKTIPLRWNVPSG